MFGIVHIMGNAGFMSSTVQIWKEWIRGVLWVQGLEVWAWGLEERTKQTVLLPAAHIQV